MTPYRLLPIAGCLLAAAVSLAAQPAPMPPVPPIPPVSPVAPVPPMPPLDADVIGEQAAKALDLGEKARELSDRIRDNMTDKWFATRGEYDKLKDVYENLKDKFQVFAQSGSYGVAVGAGSYGVGVNGRVFVGRLASDDRLYESGKSSLDAHRFDDALTAFSEVVSRDGGKVEGALYYKAYTLNKLGRRDDSLAAIADLRKSYPNSRWLDDAKALEIEVKQAAGKPVSPDEIGQDDLKLLALNGLMQTEPDRAFPVLEGLLKGAHSPNLKKQAIYVLAQNQSPKAQELLEQIARGSTGNPDLQLRAVSYFVDTKSKPNRGQLLSEIYASTNDTALKSTILSAFRRSNDAERLAQLARTEKNAELRDSAFRSLGEVNGQPELWQLYAAETAAEGKKKILHCMWNNGNTEKLAEVARTDKDASVRQAAIEALSSHKGPNVTAAMVAMYGAEQDVSVRKTMIRCLADRRDAKSLMDIGRQEKDVELQKAIVSRLVGMKTAEANDYLIEVFKK